MQVPEDVHQRPLVIVSNHVSYVDILYHMSESFPGFVAKVKENG
jgi:lysophosphatidylcholine acyltransferase/lyso-PAF acetyltransferase